MKLSKRILGIRAFWEVWQYKCEHIYNNKNGYEITNNITEGQFHRLGLS